MILLALECSSGERSIAVARDGVVLATAHRAGGRATPILGMIAAVLAEARLEPPEVGILAIGLGPGSYTGIRSAIALAEGWQLALGTRLLGVDSAAACARRAWSSGLRGPTGIIIDAQRGEFYLATYRLNDTGPDPASPLRLASRTEVDALARSGSILAGPAAGSAGLPGHHVEPDAASLLALVGLSPDLPAADATLEPIYLRETAFIKAPAVRPDLGFASAPSPTP